MKENIIQFDSYLLYNLIVSGEESFAGHFVSGKTNLPTKAEINIRLVDESPTCVVPWNSKISLSSRFLNRSFRLAHPALKSYSFIVKGFTLKESLRPTKVPLLYKMLYKIGINT